MIKATNIHKSYGDLHVLKGVNLSISESEVISVVGASGAGKTTLLQILGTLDKPDYTKNTELVINGEPTEVLNHKELAKFRNKNIGFIRKLELLGLYGKKMNFP